MDITTGIAICACHTGNAVGGQQVTNEALTTHLLKYPKAVLSRTHFAEQACRCNAGHITNFFGFSDESPAASGASIAC